MKKLLLLAMVMVMGLLLSGCVTPLSYLTGQIEKSSGTTINHEIDISYLDDIPKHPNYFTRNAFGDIINPKTGQPIICPIYGVNF